LRDYDFFFIGYRLPFGRTKAAEVNRFLSPKEAIIRGGKEINALKRYTFINVKAFCCKFALHLPMQPW